MSTSRRTGYECHVWPVEKDLQDLCRRPCLSSTEYPGVPVRAGNLPQPEFCLPESIEAKSESKVDDCNKVRDEKRFRVQRGVENQIRVNVQNYGRVLGDRKAAFPTEVWSSRPRTLTPTDGALTGDIDLSRCRDQKTPTLSSTGQLHTDSRDTFERCKSVRTSPCVTTDERVTFHAESEGEVESAITRARRIGGEASDNAIIGPSLRNVSELAERGGAPHNILPEGLDDSESIRSSTGSSRKERSHTWTENVELVRAGPIFFRDNIVECSVGIGLGERDDFGFYSVIDSQATHGKCKEHGAESGNARSQNLDHGKPQGRAIPESPQLQVLTELTSKGATCDAVSIESHPQNSGGDQPDDLGSTRARIERGLKIPRTRSDSERDVEEIAATKGRRYPERFGNGEASRGPTAGRQTSPGRAGDIPTGRESQDTVLVVSVGTAGVCTIPERIGRSAAEGLKVCEIVGCSESHSGGELVGGTAHSYSAQEGSGGSAESLTIREKTGESTPRVPDGNKIPERIGAGSDRDSAGKVQEKEKEEKLHSREGHKQESESSEERRLRTRVESSSGGACAGGDETEEPKVLRPARPSGGKDRHSKVNTAKGPRDRRVRLSVPTAVQFYDVQDRLGFDQPSKAVEWLIHKAKDAIDELGRVHVDGNEGTRVQGVSVSDFSQHGPTPSSYSAAVSALVSGGSSCTPASSFQALSSIPYGDQLSFFMDPSITRGMFAPLQPNQGNFAGPTFGLGQIDLTRVNSGSIDGGRSWESTGSPVARVESRTKARERARERTKKGPGRDGNQGKVVCEGSPSSSQSHPFHVNPTFSSFSSSSSMHDSIHSLPLHIPHETPLLAGVLEGTPFSRLMQDSHPAGPPFQNLINMHSASLDSQFTDQIQSPLQNAFLVQPQSAAATLQSPSHTMNFLQRPQLQIMQVNAQGVLQLGSTFNPGPPSSSFPEASTSSSHYTSVSTLPTVPHFSVGGMSPASSIAPHQPTGSPTPIPPGFSPGPPASAFRAQSLSVNHCSNQNQQQQLQGLSRVQRPVPSFSAAPSISTTLQAGSSSSRGATQPYYLGTSPNTLMGCLRSMASERLNSPSVAPRTNVLGYEREQRSRSMMSPPRMNPFQGSNSQIPARIQGLDDMEELEDELNPATPSSPHP